ncbi:MAG TPA: chemotaxis protein CheA [Gemmatimonadales bacterium]|nr:chemotaxis protein CheA [Gemmatimonadales bacterium]
MDVSKYAAIFLAESREHLSSCNHLLLKWERDPSATDAVGGLFRSIHTIKGMAATMGFTGVAELAHRMESLLDAVRQGRFRADEGTFQLLFRAVDALGHGVEQAAAGREPPLDATLTAALEAATGGAPMPSGSAPSQAEPPRRRATDAPRGRSVQVVIRPDAVMRGARAILAVRRAEVLGMVSAVRPSLVQLEREEFDGRLGFRIESRATEEELAAAIRTAGEVQSVLFEESATAEAADGAGRQRQIRVDLGRLDRLMKQVGELVVAKNRLGVMAAASEDPALAEVSDRISRLVSGMQAEVIASRMTPVGEVFERFPRLVRDLARDLGKRIRFDLEGEEIELDRSILDEIGDPLLHLIRNAADHGIEAPEVRAGTGKPPEGRILLAATRERNSVTLRVSDDGRGIDRAAILAKARREGADATVAPGDAESVSDDHLLRVLARPGFSTAQAVSGVSGRGVGVDVAMTRVRQLGGTIEIRSELGKGTTFLIRVPLTLAIVRALLADAGGERYAVPLAYVAETVEFNPRAVTALRSREALVVREQVIPTVHLRDLVSSRGQAVPARRPTVILEVGERRTALVVDALLGQQDIVVAPFDAPRGMPPYVGGATILADGAPALVLDAAALL